MGFVEGFNAGSAMADAKRRRAMDAERERRAGELHETQMSEYRAQAARRAQEDAAWNQLETAQTRGMATAGAGDVSAAGVQQTVANGYGQGEMRTTGDAAVKEMAGDYARELGRFAQAPGAPAGMGAPRAQMAALATNGPEMRQATGMEINQAKQGVARARRDLGSLDRLELDATRMRVHEEANAIMKDPARMGAMIKDLNLNDNRLTFIPEEKDQKGKITRPAYLSMVDDDGVSKLVKLTPGQQQALLRGQLMSQDPRLADEGIALLSSVDKSLADRARSFNDSANLAAASSQRLYGMQGDQDHRAAALAESGRHNRAMEGHSAAQLRLAQQREERERWAPIGAGNEGRTLQMWSRDGNFKSVPVPEGVDARSFFPKQSDTKWHDMGNNERVLMRGNQPLARYDPQHGAMPLAPMPKAPKDQVSAFLGRYGADQPTAMETPSGEMVWAYPLPDNTATTDRNEAFQAWKQMESVSRRTPEERARRDAMRRSGPSGSAEWDARMERLAQDPYGMRR